VGGRENVRTGHAVEPLVTIVHTKHTISLSCGSATAEEGGSGCLEGWIENLSDVDEGLEAPLSREKYKGKETVSRSTGPRNDCPSYYFICERKNPPLRVFLNPSFELLTVELTLPTGVLLFSVRVVKESGAALSSEELDHRSVSADFHGAELVKLP